MLGATDEMSYFESIKPELLKSDRGRFAVICGRRLIGIYDSVNESLAAMAEAFEEYNLPTGTPILITEIAEAATVRVMATSTRPRVTGNPATAG